MNQKSYSPVSSYQELKRVQEKIEQCQTIAELKKVVNSDGPKIGYKAFCYLLGEKMSPEAMKPDEACVAADILEESGQRPAAQEIYRRVLAADPNHPLAKKRLGV